MKYVEVHFHLSPCNDDWRDILSALLAEDAGFETFEPDGETGLRAYVQQTQFSRERIDEVRAVFPLPGVEITYTAHVAEDRNWNEKWEKNGFAPLRIGEQIHVHDSRYPADPAVPYDILINPRQAFGTGTHQTTALIMQYLLDTDLYGMRVLDAGCGTGILSILAALLRACEVLAYDIDEWSVKNTRENLALNGISNVEVKQGDSGVLLRRPRFDLVLANINRNILLHDMPAFTAVMHPGSRLIISGFYTTDIPVLVEAAQSHGLHLETQGEKDGWAMLTFRR